MKKIVSRLVNEPYTSIGKGYRLDGRQNRLEEIILLDRNRSSHLFMAATTQVGKTRLVEHMVEQDIKKEYNVVIIDPKIDNGLFSKVYQTAMKTGRIKELMLLSAVFPQYSVKINPLAHFYMEEELINTVMAGVPSKEEFFYNVALETTTAIVKSLLMIKRATNDRVPINFEDVSRYAHYNGLIALKESIGAIPEKNEPEKDRLISLIEQILASPVDYFAKVSNTLRTSLSQMTLGNIGTVFGSARSNPFMERLERDEGVILYVQTGSMLVRKTADAMAKVIISMIQGAAGRQYASGKSFEHKLCLYIDEMSNSVYPGVEDLYNKGGSAGVYITGLTQSMADLVAELGAERAQKLFSNTNTKIFGRVTDLRNAELIARYGGTQKINASMFNSSGGITARETENTVIKPEDVMRLKPREIFYFGFEGEFRGKTAPVYGSEIVVRTPDVTSASDTPDA